VALDRLDKVYKSCLDMCSLNQEVLRTVLLNAQFRPITRVDVFKGDEWPVPFDTVAHEGGNLTLSDLDDYRVMRSGPIEISYRDYRTARATRHGRLSDACET